MNSREPFLVQNPNLISTLKLDVEVLNDPSIEKKKEKSNVYNNKIIYHLVYKNLKSNSKNQKYLKE